MKNAALSLILCFPLLIFHSCSVTEHIPRESYLLDKVEVRCDDKELRDADLQQYIRQKGNTRLFSLFKVSLGAYALTGNDTTKWINRTLRNIGEEPVIYDTLQTLQTCDDLAAAAQSMGYMNARASYETKFKGRKAEVVYTLDTGQPYYIRHINLEIADTAVSDILSDFGTTLSPGTRFSITRLDSERKRVTKYLNDNGYYRFNKEYVTFLVDTFAQRNEVDVTMRIDGYRRTSDQTPAGHPRYIVGSVTYTNTADSGVPCVSQYVLAENTWITPGQPYSISDVQRTYSRIGRLSALRYANIRFTENEEVTGDGMHTLDCTIQTAPAKVNSISVQPEGTNTAGDLGAALSVTYQNRNIFHGSETFSLSLRGAFEAITGLEGYQNQDYMEYSAETSLLFPRMIAPFVSRRFRKNSQATSQLSVSFNMQNRPEFHRRVFSAAWRYRWTNRNRRAAFRIDVLDIDYVYMPWISAKFKQEYLDSVSNRNAILKYNYEDLLIMKIGVGMTYNDGVNALKAGVEMAGNITYGINNMLGSHKNSDGQYQLAGIAYAQYAKIDVDYTRLVNLGNKQNLAMHVALGIAYPYGNSTVLPFEKRYFSGGANSVRGWSVRELGPGKFRGTDGNIDFINQTGDMKLDLNIEYRTPLFWKFYGAAFVDAGNIWTLRAYDEQPGGQFHFDSFYEQIAVAYGVGLRLNFDYFILRFDLGMKAINPAYTSQHEHYALTHPDISRDSAFHFAVGLPF